MNHPIIHQTDLFHPHGDPDNHFEITDQDRYQGAMTRALSALLVNL